LGYFLGVDAGGTKTEFLLGDATRELARVRVGSIKRMRVSADDAEANLRKALTELTRLSGVNMRQIEHCRVGAAGNSVHLVSDWLRDAFTKHVGGELSLVNDVEIALDAAFAGKRGVVVLAGTGSNVAARDRDGVISTAGGWGPLMADQGSGNYLGMLGLRRGFLAIDQQRSTTILSAALRFWNLADIDDLVAYVNQSPAPDFSRLAPLFVACAEQGDLVAGEVMRQSGEDLADLVILLLERLRATEGEAEFQLPEIAVTGSVITHARPMRESVHAALLVPYPAIKLRREPADPPVGALWGARRAAQALVGM
jgi:N-acetylglucosamine kinase-like BadF-type ATPase